MAKTLRVGIFVGVGLLVSVATVFILGDNRRLWDSKAHYEAVFDDVQGLKSGSPVRMGGLDVGTVTAVGYGKDLTDSKIHVSVAVAQGEAKRIRKNSVIRVANKGLLGDKMVEISVGDPAQPAAVEGSTLQADMQKDLFARADEIAKRAEHTITNLDKIAGDPKFADDVKGTVSSLHVILDGIAHKDGPAHRLIFDPEEGKRIDHMIANLDQMSVQLNGVASDIHTLTADAKNGKGLAHALVYDERLVENTNGVLQELHQTLSAVRTGNGLAHVVVYGDDQTQHVMANISQMTDDLKVLVANVRAGKGTIGGLLVDPSVYEDLKSLLGNVERNQVLRALVRYSIKADEQKKPLEAPNAAPIPKK